ncbi:MAG: hypothetical protein FWD23_15275 [Oscillospiraceae bacterium]|nr:hypothetical protein [Oscillospiraceae bacterium]
MKSPISHKNTEREINEQLRKLRLLPMAPANIENSDKTAGHIAQIHSYDQTQNKLPRLGAEWTIRLVRESETCPCITRARSKRRGK